VVGKFGETTHAFGQCALKTGLKAEGHPLRAADQLLTQHEFMRKHVEVGRRERNEGYSGDERQNQPEAKETHFFPLLTGLDAAEANMGLGLEAGD
jgi:hypothetical protein